MTQKRPGITGVTIIKNAVSLGYPLYYSAKSVMPACDEFVISDGFSTDGTDKIIARLKREYGERITVVKKRWGRSASGEVIADVTNDALRCCKTRWIYYIQADEIVHEDNLKIITQIPERFGMFNSVSFPFLHFRPTLHYILKNPAYQVAIRMFKNYHSVLRAVIMEVLRQLPHLSLVRAGTDLLFRKRDVHSIADGWSFEGNIRPVLDLSRSRKVHPIFHVGYVCKDRDTVIRRAREHAQNIYINMKEYQEMSKKAEAWDGTLSRFWTEVVPYKDSNYPRLVHEWLQDED